MNTTTSEELRDYAWKYFALHADQRIKMFHFFIILETAMVAGLLVAAKGTAGVLSPIPNVLAVLPLMMTIIAFVFWKLDVRTRAMIHNAETALRAVENTREKDLDPLLKESSRIFGIDDRSLETNKPLRYSHCFGIVFVSFGLLGLAATGWVAAG